MSNRVYDALKDISLCWMPIGITFAGVVISAFGVPYGEQIMTVAVAANTALGGIVKYYAYKYKEEQDGTD